MVIAIRAATVAVAVFLSIFVFRLGYFFPAVAIVGSVVAVLVAARSLRPLGQRATSIGAAIASYSLMFGMLVWAFVGKSSSRTLDAVWQDRGSVNSDRDSEVFLEFSDFPGHGVGVYSTALRNRLAEVGNASTQVEFLVTSDLGCVRGVRHVRVGNITDPAVLNGRGGYARSGQSGPSPWAAQWWWCR